MFGRARIPLTLGLAVLAAASPARDGEPTAVSASVYHGYERNHLPDGTLKPETFAFGEGGLTTTATKDTSLEGQTFGRITRTLAPALARQGYVGSQDPAKTDLLIMVYWGETATDGRVAGGYARGATPITPPRPPPKIIAIGRTRVYVPNTDTPATPTAGADQPAYDAVSSAQNRERDRENFRTARLLGYGDAFDRAATRPEGHTYQDLVDELEDARYYVILQAYDFRALWKEKKHTLLWEARYSIRARGHDFDQALGAMTVTAARHFGRATKGLVREEIPAGEVKLGDPEFKEYLPAAKP